MSAADQWTTEQAGTLVCAVCGAPWKDHQGADHAFMPQCPYYSATWRRGARFAHAGLDQAADVYITVEDRMRVNIVSGIAGVEVDVMARIARPDGQVIPMRQQFFPGSARALQTFDFDLCEGFLLDVVVSTPTAGVRRGGVWCDVNLIRGQGANAFPVRDLIDDYLTLQSNPAFPDGENTNSVTGGGFLRAVQQANPAAGAEFVVTVPAGARWEVLSINAQLVTSAAVANRQPVFQITDGATHVMHNTQFSGNQAASLTFQYSAAEGDSVAVNAPFNQGALPHNCFLLQGWTLQSLTTNIQAADQWSAIWLMVQEWSEL